MGENQFTFHENRSVIRQLAGAFRKENHVRNRILLAAVSLCVLVLTGIFGIAYGKVQAEYVRTIRQSGETASTYLNGGTKRQYEQIQGLSYVKYVGRRNIIGNAYYIQEVGKEGEIGRIEVLDAGGWNDIVKPAYTDIEGLYPEKSDEIMLSKEALRILGVKNPQIGRKISLKVEVGLFQKKEQEFYLSGWYQDYIQKGGTKTGGYISEKKAREWGYDIDQSATILISQKDQWTGRQTEDRLYKDVTMKDSGQQIVSANTAAYEATDAWIGSYGSAIILTLMILAMMFFLVHNVMQISMASDIRQLGLLHTLGATKKQLKKVYYRQMSEIMIVGLIIGSILSVLLLKLAIPEILGKQYLDMYGGAEDFSVFRGNILVMAIVFTGFLMIFVCVEVIHRMISLSCVESVVYTGVKKERFRVHNRSNFRIRSSRMELLLLAWKNVIRYPIRYIFTVLSLTLAVITFFSVMRIADKKDYTHVIEERPDYLIAGQFSQWGQQEGYGKEYQTRKAGEDPMKTQGDNFSLLYDNEYDEYAPISGEVRDELLDIDGVEKSYIMEGAYLYSVLSRKGIRPLVTENVVTEKILEAENVESEVSMDYGDGTSMVEGSEPDTVQILKDCEIEQLKKYVDDKHLQVDMQSLENGTGVLIIHDHMLSKIQEDQAKKSVGEPIYFKKLLEKDVLSKWIQMLPEERASSDTSTDSGIYGGEKSQVFTLCGYLDNQAEDFPQIRQSWHGAEGFIYYFISEKGFEKLPTEKKTIYMELSVNPDKEKYVKRQIQEILSRENQKRADETYASWDRVGEAGIFYISKSDLLRKSQNYIWGNRMIYGSISIIMLIAGVTNYCNVVMTGILSRRKELEIMRKIGMTKKQQTFMLVAENGIYLVSVATLVALGIPAVLIII